MTFAAYLSRDPSPGKGNGDVVEYLQMDPLDSLEAVRRGIASMNDKHWDKLLVAITNVMDYSHDTGKNCVVVGLHYRIDKKIGKPRARTQWEEGLC